MHKGYSTGAHLPPPCSGICQVYSPRWAFVIKGLPWSWIIFIFSHSCRGGGGGGRGGRGCAWRHINGCLKRPGDLTDNDWLTLRRRITCLNVSCQCGFNCVIFNSQVKGKIRNWAIPSTYYKNSKQSYWGGGEVMIRYEYIYQFLKTNLFESKA